MKWIIKKYGVLLLYCCMVAFLSCTTDSETEAVVIVEEEIPEEKLVLKKVNFHFADETPYFIEFSEVGLPVSGNRNTFSYDSENRLIENIILTGGMILPRSYIYEEGLLVGLNTYSFMSSGGISVLHGEILYEEGNKVIHNYSNLERATSYTFSDDTYNHILSLGYDVGLNSSNIFHKRFEYQYDSEMILVLVNEYEMDETTGEEIHTHTFEIEYDTKWNPYYKFKDHHPIVFNLLPFDFDNPYLNFIEPHLRRNAKHNVASILRTRLNDGSEYDFSFVYEYNEEDYPIKRTRHNSNGNLMNIIDFEYY